MAPVQAQAPPTNPEGTIVPEPAHKGIDLPPYR
jgi:hypothetical protein